MGNDAERERRGAPITQRRRIPMGIRVAPELRAVLVARAESNGRSITQETELLIERGLEFGRIYARLESVESKLDQLLAASRGDAE